MSQKSGSRCPFIGSCIASSTVGCTFDGPGPHRRRSPGCRTRQRCISGQRRSMLPPVGSRRGLAATSDAESEERRGPTHGARCSALKATGGHASSGRGTRPPAVGSPRPTSADVLQSPHRGERSDGEVSPPMTLPSRSGIGHQVLRPGHARPGYRRRAAVDEGDGYRRAVRRSRRPFIRGECELRPGVSSRTTPTPRLGEPAQSVGSPPRPVHGGPRSSARPARRGSAAAGTRGRRRRGSAARSPAADPAGRRAARGWPVTESTSSVVRPSRRGWRRQGPAARHARGSSSAIEGSALASESSALSSNVEKNGHSRNIVRSFETPPRRAATSASPCRACTIRSG